MNLTHSSKGTALVIEDHPEHMQVLIAALQACSVTIVVASQGKPALGLAIQVMPDLILLDVRQPDMQGLETFRRLRANPATSDIPIIVMASPTEAEAVFELTGPLARTEIIDGAESAGVDYLIAPFQANEVMARVSAHLTIRKLKRRLSEPPHQENGNFRETIESYERDLIVTALERHHGNMAQTAAGLAIPLRTLYRKIKHYQLS